MNIRPRIDRCRIALVIAFLLMFQIGVLREVLELRLRQRRQESMVYLPQETVLRVERLLQAGGLPVQNNQKLAGADNINGEPSDKEEAKRSSYELERFNNMLKAWPVNKPKAAIYILVKSSRFTSTLKDGLDRLDRYFNDIYHYPLVLFHETGVSDTDIASIRSWTRSDVYFQLVKFSVPKWINETKLEGDIAKAGDKRYGYRHMCRFHAISMQVTPIMRLVDYYWRLDDDSRLIGQVPFDLFKFMAKGNLTYGYVHMSPENPDYVVGLYPRVNSYLTNKQIQPTFFRKLHRNRYFFNNFELASLHFWRSKNVSEFLNALDRSGGFYYHRWGDAVVKTLVVSIFAPIGSVYQFTEVPYVHKNVNTTSREFRYAYGRNLAQMVMY
ncbi:O-glycoside alpha-1,2-mannosyltransferase omh1 [Lingula anatina]|uniref:O-glycoside alpha-1,2-mannosyltransferase omh1 n=1 Tax=Lingula anatina TaxID=7574 RepID=A0A1S3HQC9_LINAN|nr:O-glycoside alpha-1,2-mannosyltransferase omh1 [Lingula anatina]|eukprot:XP_013387244.1 O-glycoside alpha-1,2-mannosyltransferase omh1 [Lingula anatina]